MVACARRLCEFSGGIYWLGFDKRVLLGLTLHSLSLSSLPWCEAHCYSVCTWLRVPKKSRWHNQSAFLHTCSMLTLVVLANQNITCSPHTNTLSVACVLCSHRFRYTAAVTKYKKAPNNKISPSLAVRDARHTSSLPSTRCVCCHVVHNAAAAAAAAARAFMRTPRRRAYSRQTIAFQLQ